MRDRPRRIAFLAPMPPELRPLTRRLSMRPARAHPDGLRTGTLGTAEVVATTTGMGPASAEACTRAVLASGPVDHVVVIGVAGAIGAEVHVGDVVVPATVIDLDSGQELAASPLGSATLAGSLITAATFITDIDELTALADRGIGAIDMESSAVARVCTEHGIPWTVFRGISDDVFDTAVDDDVFGLNKADGSPDLAAVARFVAAKPSRARLLARLARQLRVATNGAVEAALDAGPQHRPR